MTYKLRTKNIVELTEEFEKRLNEFLATLPECFLQSVRYSTSIDGDGALWHSALILYVEAVD